MGSQMHFICTSWMAHITVNQSAASGIRLVAECLSETRKLLTRESARFSHKATDRGSQTVQKRWLFASPGTGPKQQRDFILLQATKLVHRSVCWGSWRRDAEQTQAKPTTKYRRDAVLCNTAELVEPLISWQRQVAPEKHGRLASFWEELRNAKRQWSLKYHPNCNREVYQSGTGSGRTAALDEELPGRIKKPRTK